MKTELNSDWPRQRAFFLNFFSYQEQNYLITISCQVALATVKKLLCYCFATKTSRFEKVNHELRKKNEEN